MFGLDIAAHEQDRIVAPIVAVMMALGVQLVQQAALRVTHRKVLLVVFVLFLMHLYLKFTL